MASTFNLASVAHPDLNAGVLEELPLERAETLPASWYTDDVFHRLDLELVLARSWQYVGPASKVAKGGDTLVHDVAGRSIAVVRGHDGVLRAFHNVCRHRGGPLVLEDGPNRALTCKYHGWTYALDGRLQAASAMEGAVGFDKAGCRLPEARVDVWDGLVFVNLESDPAVPLATLFTGVSERISPVVLARKKFARRINYYVDCNWKTYMDNFLEGYHIPFVHPELNKMLDFRNYVTELHEHYILQYSPFSARENIYGDNSVNAWYYMVAPNIMLNIMPGRLQMNLIVPIAPNRTLTVFDFYFDDLDSPEAQKLIADDIAISELIQREDMDICRQVQKGLESGSYRTGRFSPKYENGVHYFQSLVKRAYAAHFGAAAGRAG